MSLLRSIWRLVLRSGTNFYRDNCLDLAATVAFYTLLSLAPLLYLVGATLALVFHGEPQAEVIVERIGSFLPEAATPLLGTVVDSLKSGQPLLLLAIPGLIWVATSAFAALEYAINVAAGTARRRTFWLSRLKVLAVMLAAWLLLVFELVGGTVMPRLERLRQSLAIPLEPLEVPGLSSSPIPLIATFLSFLLFYKMLPRGRVSWRAALSGAGLALVCWEGARMLFSAMLVRSPAFGLLTGTLSAVVAFLMWIYTAVAVILLGAEVAGVMNGRPDPPPGRAPGVRERAQLP